MKVLIDAFVNKGEIMVLRNGVPAGVAARNIEAGEVIDYIPGENTDDIIVRYLGEQSDSGKTKST